MLTHNTDPKTNPSPILTTAKKTNTQNGGMSGPLGTGDAGCLGTTERAGQNQRPCRRSNAGSRVGQRKRDGREEREHGTHDHDVENENCGVHHIRVSFAHVTNIVQSALVVKRRFSGWF